MKVAIVGCGGLGNIHASCYSKIPGVTVVGVCDIDNEAAQSLSSRTGAAVYESFAEMLETSGCDVVSVTLPSHLHKSFTIQAAQAGKHVICEKPIALNLDDAAEMIRVCEERGVRLFIGHVVRFFPEYVQMRAKVAAGAVGRVGVVHTKRAGGHPGDRRPWFKDYDKSGGVVADLMVHDIDFLRWTLGEVKSVYGLHRVEESSSLEYASATFIFESGAVANLEGYWGYPGPFRTSAEIAGSKGVIQSDSLKASSLQIRKVKGADAAGPFVEVPQSPGYRTPFEIELNHFIDCIREEREPVVTAKDAYKALELALAVMESARSGKAVIFEQSAREGSR